MPIPLDALLLILVASLAFSALDLLRKKLMGSVAARPLLVLLTAGAAPVFWLWWRWSGAAGPSSAYLWPGLGVVVLNIAANVLFLEAVRVSPLSATIPFLSLTPVFTTILAIPLLGELPSSMQAVGILFVVIGAFGLNLEGGFAGLRPRALWEAYRGERGSVLMTLVALFWSFAAPLDKLAVQSASPAFHGLIANAGVGLGVLVLVVARREVADLRRGLDRWQLLIAATVFGFLSIAALLEAIQRMPVGLAETLKRAIGSFAALASGYVFFSEAITLPRVFAVGVMAAGVALLLLA